MTDNMLDTTEEEALAEKIVRNMLEIERLQAEVDVLKDYFKSRPEAYPAGLKKEIGKFFVRVSANRRVDDGLAKRELPAMLYKRASKTVIDSTLAKKMLTEEQYNKIVKNYDNRIEVGLR
jgi:hypothetical protein